MLEVILKSESLSRAIVLFRRILDYFQIENHYKFSHKRTQNSSKVVDPLLQGGYNHLRRK